MKTFDRCIFVSIAVGIWAYILIQFFVPSSVIAHGWHSHSYTDIDDFASAVENYHHDHLDYAYDGHSHNH